MKFIFAFFLISISSKASEPACEFKMYWGHGDNIRKYIKEDMNNSNICVVGQGCYLREKSGNLQGLMPSNSLNGDWMALNWNPWDDSLKKDFNGGFNPYYSEADLPLSLTSQRPEPKNKTYVKYFDNMEYSEEHILKYRNKIDEINAVGFFRLTEHNWMTLLLNAMKNSIYTPQKSPNDRIEKKCPQVKIHFECKYNQVKKPVIDEYGDLLLPDQEVWDKRLLRATSTKIKDDNEMSIKTSIKKCAQVKDSVSKKLIDVYNIPRTCGQTLNLDWKSLTEIYEGCEELFFTKTLFYYENIRSYLSPKKGSDYKLNNSFRFSNKEEFKKIDNEKSKVKSVLPK